MILPSKLLPVWSITRAIMILLSKLLPVWSIFREIVLFTVFLREIALWPLLIRKNTITNQPLGQEWNYCPSGTQNYCPRGFATWAIMSSFGAIISFLPAWLVSNSILCTVMVISNGITIVLCKNQREIHICTLSRDRDITDLIVCCFDTCGYNCKWSLFLKRFRFRIILSVR